MLGTGVACTHSEKGTVNNCEVTDCETCNDHTAGPTFEERQWMMVMVDREITALYDSLII